jgi:hypothetical protein
MNGTPAHSIWRCDHWKQVAKIGYLLQRTGSYSLAHDAVLTTWNIAKPSSTEQGVLLPRMTQMQLELDDGVRSSAPQPNQ